jgi:hypothetical protein
MPRFATARIPPKICRISRDVGRFLETVVTFRRPHTHLLYLHALPFASVHLSNSGNRIRTYTAFAPYKSERP